MQTIDEATEDIEIISISSSFDIAEQTPTAEIDQSAARILEVAPVAALGEGATTHADADWAQIARAGTTPWTTSSLPTLKAPEQEAQVLLEELERFLGEPLVHDAAPARSTSSEAPWMPLERLLSDLRASRSELPEGRLPSTDRPGPDLLWASVGLIIALAALGISVVAL